MSNEGLRKRTITSTLWDYGASVLQAVTQLVALAILSRLIAPAEFGAFAILAVCITFGTVLATWGVNRALVQKADIDDGYVATCFWLVMAGGVTVGSLMIIGAPLIERVVGDAALQPLLIGASPYFVLFGIGVTSESLLQRELNFRAITVARVGSYTVGYGLTAIVLAVLGFGIWALVYATLAEALVKSGITLAYRRHAVARPPQIAKAQELLGFGSGLVASRLLNSIAIEGDYVVVGRFLGAATLGVYTRAYQLAALPANFLGQTLQRVLFAAMSRVQDEREKLREAYLDASSALSTLSYPLAALLAVTGREVVNVIVGPQWTQAIVPFQILVAVLVFRAGYKIDDAVATSTGHIRQRVGRDSIYAAATVGGVAIGAQFGIVAATVGAALAITLNYALSVRMSLGIVHASWRDYASAQRPGWILGLIVLLLALAVRHLCLWASISDVWTLLITVLSVTALMSGLLIGSPRLFGPRMLRVSQLFLSMLPERRVLRWLSARLPE